MEVISILLLILILYLVYTSQLSQNNTQIVPQPMPPTQTPVVVVEAPSRYVSGYVPYIRPTFAGESSFYPPRLGFRHAPWGYPPMRPMHPPLGPPMRPPMHPVPK
jgi:energy-converting hydrogenase Eha subunit F